jgi:hypothetical protein
MVVEEKVLLKQNLHLKLQEIEQHYKHNYYNKDLVKLNN